MGVVPGCGPDDGFEGEIRRRSREQRAAASSRRQHRRAKKTRKAKAP